MTKTDHSANDWKNICSRSTHVISVVLCWGYVSTPLYTHQLQWVACMIQSVPYMVYPIHPDEPQGQRHTKQYKQKTPAKSRPLASFCPAFHG